MRLPIFVSVVMLCSIAVLGQTVIDATGPIRGRLRNPTAGHVGSIGRKLPIQIAVEYQRPQPQTKDAMNVCFILTNTGEKELAIPVSPHPGDLEPQDKNVTYTVKHLNLYMTSISNKRQELVLAGGAQLFGNEGLPKTMLTLGPGKLVRVLARVQVPSGRLSDRTILFVAHAALDSETMRTVDGQTFEDSEEIGIASSTAYKAQSLFELSK